MWKHSAVSISLPGAAEFAKVHAHRSVRASLIAPSSTCASGFGGLNVSEWRSLCASSRGCSRAIFGASSWALAAAKQSPGWPRTCRICKMPFDPDDNHPAACRFHTAHFGGETKRKFESAYIECTLNTPGGGEILQYWHCCGNTDPLNAGCGTGPHYSYDD